MPTRPDRTPPAAGRRGRIGFTIAGLSLSVTAIPIMVVFVCLAVVYNMMVIMASGNAADLRSGYRALYIVMLWVVVPITTIALVCSTVGVARENARGPAIAGIAVSIAVVVLLLLCSPILFSDPASSVTSTR